MDKIPLQTLKIVEKVSSEDRINELYVQCASVRRNFKPTVRTRREFERDDSVEYDHIFEEKIEEIEADIEDIYMKETLTLIEEELRVWKDQKKYLLIEFNKLHETEPQDQELLRRSDEKIQALLIRVNIIENIKKSLIKEVDKLCLKYEKTRADASDKLKRTNANYKEIIRFLNRGFEAERVNFQHTTEILRKIEQSLRETMNHYENSEATVGVLQEELKKTKHQLHSCQNMLTEHDISQKKVKTEIRQLEAKLEDALDRAELAESALKRCRSKIH